MESRQERMEKRQERMERMLERMERNLERMERRLESIERTQSRIERQTAEVPLSDYSDYLEASDEDGVSIGGVAASAAGSGAYGARRHEGDPIYGPRRRHEGDGRPPPGYYRRPYSMSTAAPNRHPPEIYYTAEQPPVMVPGYRRGGYDGGESTLVINSQMGETTERSPRSHRDDRRARRRSRRHGSDDDISPARVRREEIRRVERREETMKKTKLDENQEWLAPPMGQEQDRWRTVKPNPDPKPDIIRPSTVRGDPGLLDDDDDY